MKCILFTSVLSGGGAERVLCQLANRLSQNHTVILAAAYPSENEYDIHPCVRKIYLDQDVANKKPWKQILCLRKLIKLEKPDICISFLPQPNFKMLLASVGLRNKVIVSVRNDPAQEYKNWKSKLLADVLYRTADGIVFQTKDAQEFFADRIKKKSRIIMNQVNPAFFQTEAKTEEYYVATGRLNKQKNYPMMIRSFARFTEKHPNEKLHIYGAGDLSGELQMLIESLGAEDKICLMGSTNDVPGVLSRAKCFLLTSDFEGMPNGLLEAVAVGLPCISTDCPCGGPGEIIKDGISGILIPVRDEEALYQALCDVQNNEGYRRRMAENARNSAMRYHPDAIFQIWLAYIRETVEGKRR